MGPNLGDKKCGRLPPISNPTRQAEQSQQQQTKTLAPPANIQVQLTWSLSGRRSVALKTFQTASPRTLDEDSYGQLVAYEVLAMDRVISHPNVVRLLEVKKVSPYTVYLVMEAAAASRGSLMELIVTAPQGR